MKYKEKLKSNPHTIPQSLATCERCIYWKDDETDDIVDTGFCHRFPPVLGHGRSLEHDKYPRTRHNDWCGEFEDLS